MSAAGPRPLLEVRDLVKHFPVVRAGFGGSGAEAVRAVDGVSFDVHEGETLAVVGESGCGKSTVGKLVLNLIRPTAGTVRFEGREISGLSERAMRPVRRRMQIVFQDPFASLNPRMTVGEILAEPLAIHGLARGGAARRRRVAELLDVVGLSPNHAGRYPHEFSGGQRQRIGIARALSVEPRLVVGDEPVSALDVSIQAQIINLLEDLQARFGLTLIVISHDLAVVRHMSDRVLVMYLGKAVEIAPTRALFARPRHPYTQALMSAIPRPRGTAAHGRVILTGDVPSPIDPPSGCRFHTRCPHARERCRVEEPALVSDEGGHGTACHFWREIAVPDDIVALTRPRHPPYQARLDLFRRHQAERASAGGGG
ncbi:MAG TPA: dipeptide ABC transporter ATP-binding protein [Geminicoccaceae bacterium]|nr:dipeptide ABC transporter ATP-binding protein [Geminicoccaceae bacterium]